MRKNRKFLKLGGKKNAKKTGGMPAEYFGAPMNKAEPKMRINYRFAFAKNTVNNKFCKCSKYLIFHTSLSKVGLTYVSTNV